MPHETIMKISNEYLFKFPPIYAMISSYLGIKNHDKFNNTKKSLKIDNNEVKNVSNMLGAAKAKDISKMSKSKQDMLNRLINKK